MKRYTKAELLDAVLTRVKADGLNVTAITAGMSASFLCNILNGKAPLSDNAATKLGFRKLPDAYVKKTEEM